MEAPPITFDQLPHVVSGLSEKLDRVLDILERVGIANPIKNVKPSRGLVYAKEACTSQLLITATTPPAPRRTMKTASPTSMLASESSAPPVALRM